MSAELQTQLEEKLARRKRIFNEVAIEVATSEPEAISKLIRQTVDDVETLREKESALRRIFADKIATLNDERLAQLRTYVPIPPSLYKDDAQEKRTRPSKGDKFTEESSTVIARPRAKATSAEDKNAAAVAKALGMTIDEAKAWLESKKMQAKPVINPQPVNGIKTDEISQEDLDAEAADNEINLPE